MARFLIKPFDTEAVVFDAASGDTHYLSPLAFQLLSASQASPGLAYQRIAEALEQQGVPVNAIDHQKIDEAILSLQHIGLLNPT